MIYTVGSLFSGIGGFELGLERTGGFRTVWQSEIDTYCSRVLKKHWPDVPNLGDVTKINWNEVEPVDVICGGYPCQPFSTASAGARQGRDDPRHLWPYMRDAISVLRPRSVLLENVSGHLSLGFGDVLGDLAACGYNAEWDCIPAVAVGAPHRRDRVFITAHSNTSSEHDGSVDAETSSAPQSPTHTDSGRCVGRTGERATPARWRQPEDCGWWTVEPDVGRVAHGVPRRVDRLRGLGNAVVPQVAEFIGEQLLSALEVRA